MINLFPAIPKIYFDFGSLSVLPRELDLVGIRRPLLVTDEGLVSCGIMKRVVELFPREAGVPVFSGIPENPTVQGVEKAHELYMQEGCDGLVAVGGGSVIDSTKATALLAGHPGPLSRYSMHPERITRAAAPLIAVPTTAGTGSEVSRGAGIHPDDSTQSMSVGSEFLQSRAALCDPELTLSLPKMLTAGTGMDALSHCIEGFLSASVNPPVDNVALDGVRRVLAYVERAVADGGDREARWHMLMAALEGGISIGKGLGPAHAAGNTLGDKGFHHGALLAVLTPSVLRFYESRSIEKMDLLAQAFGLEKGSEVAVAVDSMNRRLGLPATLKDMGYPVVDLDQAAQDCVDSHFNRTCEFVPTHAEYKMIIQDAMG